jgi:hypothetical protein
MRFRQVGAENGPAHCVRRAPFLWKHEASTSARGIGNGGENVQLTRTYGTCPKCGAGLFPLDEELGLLPGTLAPRQQEHLVHLASYMPFKQAVRMLGALLGVQIGEEAARRLTERMGAHLEAAQTAEADAPASHESTNQPAPERCVLSVDGAMNFLKP